jgi:hypothetical protein
VSTENRTERRDPLGDAEQVADHERRNTVEWSSCQRFRVDAAVESHIDEPDLKPRGDRRRRNGEAGVGGNQDLRAATLGGEVDERDPQSLATGSV